MSFADRLVIFGKCTGSCFGGEVETAVSRGMVGVGVVVKDRKRVFGKKDLVRRIGRIGRRSRVDIGVAEERGKER